MKLFFNLKEKISLLNIGNWISLFSLITIIFWSLFLLQSFFLAFTDQFKTPFLYSSLFSSLVLTLIFGFFIKKDVRIFPSIGVLPAICIMLVSFLLIFYPHDTFGGRDEAVYTNYSVHLFQTGSLKVPSYLDNLPDKLAKGVRITPPLYPVWLGIQKALFGTPGLLRSNVILVVLGLFSFFAICSYLGNKKLGLASLAIYCSCMPFLWFSRETMSENLSFFLLWAIILFFFLCLRTKRLIYLIGTFICSWLFALTRLEGFLIQLIILLILPTALFLAKSFDYKKIFAVTFIYILVVASNVPIANQTYGHSLKTVIPAVGQSVKKDASAFLVQKVPILKFVKSSPAIEKIRGETLSGNFFIFVTAMLTKYNFLLVIFSIFLVVFQLLTRIKKITSKDSYFFLTFLIILPEFYKIISPGVTLDQPWFYRRYIYALLPLGYFSLFLIINKLKNNRFFVIIFGLLLLTNIFLSKDILFLKNNWSLVERMEEITKNVTKEDFVIIKNRTLGYYYPASFLTFQKGVRYAFESTLASSLFFPEKKFFNGVSYNKIFFLSTLENESYPPFKIINQKTIDVEYNQLIPSCQLNFLAEEEGQTYPYNISIIPVTTTIKYCSLPKNEIVKKKEKLYLYEIVHPESSD